MSGMYNHHARHLKGLMTANDELQAHLYLEQLMLFPVDIQDKIIDEISNLKRCSTEDIAQIIHFYTRRA
ncbi:MULTISPECIES: hypothetical protein [unclassified Thalassotalea]|uniref:hypothetical protein n=1 Tax=unclassified Thalassotalea TaxID=2614972 RepID=UPI0010820B92|nr:MULTISPECIES: hypothetical protein [unclassified Thalassotalea]NMP15462.1 hypothetical protein [Thalassotalea sp. Y01]QBY05890.1 hypothetical protein E2K93_16645 [Thalassotalea sp. HSM 43]